MANVFTSGTPATSAPLTSQEIRQNLNALNSRTDRLTAVAIADTATISIGGGLVYFGGVPVQVSAQNVNLRSVGIGSTFSSTERFYFKKVLISLTYNSGTQTTALSIKSLNSSESVADNLPLPTPTSSELPICFVTVRNNGVINSTIAVQNITQDDITDARPYVALPAATVAVAPSSPNTSSTQRYVTIGNGTNTVGIYEGTNNGPFLLALADVGVGSVVTTPGWIQIKSGTYTLTGNLTINTDGVTLQGEGGKVIIDTNGFSLIVNAAKTVISQITFQDSADSAVPMIEFTTNAQKVIVSHCWFDELGVNSTNVLRDGGSLVLIDNCFSSTTHTGI